MHDSFLLTAFVYLAAAVVSVPLAKKLGLGSVLGYLLAGLVIGPSVLGLVGEKGGDVLHVAEFGVVVMLFLIGLELRPKVLWNLRVPILGMGGAQVVVTAALGAAGFMAVAGWGWKPALAAGLIIAMSSTAMVLQSLGEKGLLRTAGGQSSFSILLFQDLAVIPILAVLPLLATLPSAGGEGAPHGIGALPAWLQALSVLGAVTAIVLGGRYLMRPVFRLVASTHLREAFTALALFLVVGISLLMQTVGMSPALGAFLAGVVLADNEYRHELEGDLEPFKGLLLALFFIGVGSGIDVAYLASKPMTLFFGTLAIMSLKAVALGGIAWAFRQKAPDIILLAGALAQVGEFAFVLLSLAITQGVLGGEQAKLLTAMTALSMVLTPPLLILAHRLSTRWVHKRVKDPETKEEIRADGSPVILAGFGRMGMMVGRLLRSHGIPTKVLDLNPNTVSSMRRLGLEAWYGDAGRLDLLEAAGAAKAKVLVIAIDDPEKTLALADLVKMHYPHLKIVARARGRDDAYGLLKRGIDDVHRETFATSLDMAESTLTRLGWSPHRAHRAVRAFRRLNERDMRSLAAHWGDEKNYFRRLREAIDQEAGRFAEAEDLSLEVNRAWDNSSLRAEVEARLAKMESKPPG